MYPLVAATVCRSMGQSANSPLAVQLSHLTVLSLPGMQYTRSVPSSGSSVLSPMKSRQTVPARLGLLGQSPPAESLITRSADLEKQVGVVPAFDWAMHGDARYKGFFEVSRTALIRSPIDARTHRGGGAFRVGVMLPHATTVLDAIDPCTDVPADARMSLLDAYTAIPVRAGNANRGHADADCGVDVQQAHQGGPSDCCETQYGTRVHPGSGICVRTCSANAEH